MESNSPRCCHLPAAVRSHYHFGYGGSVTPENVTIRQPYAITSMKRSNVRLNDQLVPKPTEIDIAGRGIKAAIPKEHPYSSHISRFAMFPSFLSPDDPDSGLRAAAQATLNPLIPTSAPETTVLSKTKGAPCRHEILKQPSREKALVWPGDHGFLDQNKSVKGEGQVFYPAPPKTVFPNLKLRDWDLTLSERTANMLKNAERSLWLTSYQMHYTGSGPANPLKIDDFKEKITQLAAGEMTSPNAQLTERSYPVFVPPQPREGREARRRLGHRDLRSTSCPPAESTAKPAEPPDLYWAPTHTKPPASNHEFTYASIQEGRPQEIPGRRNGTLNPNSHLDSGTIHSHNQTEYSSDPSESESAEVACNYQTKKKILKDQYAEVKDSQCEVRERKNCKVQFEEGDIHIPMQLRGPSTNTAQETDARITDVEHLRTSNSTSLSQAEADVAREKPLNELCYKDVLSGQKQDFNPGRDPANFSHSVSQDWAAVEPDGEVPSRARNKKVKLQQVREGAQSTTDPYVRSWPPVLPGIDSVSAGAEGVAPSNRVPLLLEIQNSFSKSDVHRRLNSSITSAAVDLRDNLCTGKKYSFNGINCYYLR